MATLGGSPNRSLTARQPAANGVCRAWIVRTGVTNCTCSNFGSSARSRCGTERSPRPRWAEAACGPGAARDPRRRGRAERAAHHLPLGREPSADGGDLAPERRLTASQGARGGRRRDTGSRLRAQCREERGRRSALRAARERGAVGGSRSPGRARGAKRFNCGADRRSPTFRTSVCPERGRTARGASPDGDRGADGGRARLAAAPPSLVGELEQLVRENPMRERPRGQLMLALYRSRAAGGGAPGLPGRAQDARRGAWHRADAIPAAAARVDPAPGVRAAAAGRSRGGGGPARGGRARVALRPPRPRTRPGSLLGERREPRGTAGRGLRFARRAPRRPDASLAVRGGHPGSRPVVRPAARSLCRGRRCPARSSASWQACPS